MIIIETKGSKSYAAYEPNSIGEEVFSVDAGEGLIYIAVWDRELTRKQAKSLKKALSAAIRVV